MAENTKLSTLFKDVVWPLAWRSTVIAATMGLGALAMIKYLRGPKEETPPKSDSPTPSP